MVRFISLGFLVGCASGLDGLPVVQPADQAQAPEKPANDAPDRDDDEDKEVVDPPECPAGVTCIDSFPWSGSATTTGASSAFDAYSCAASTDESGPEKLYRLDLAEGGFVALTLDGLPSGVDVDVHLLASKSAGDCIDRGHWVAGGLLEAGTYWVVVDSWVDSSGDVKDGAYTLTVGHTTVDDLVAWGVDPTPASAALHAFDNAWLDGETDRFEYGLIDFSLPSTDRRLWVFDLGTTHLLYNDYVSHGEGSGDPNDRRYAKNFSNITDSHQSSLGLMRAAETYTGSKGYSMRLDGLESGVNSAVRSRAIVMHPATYSTPDFINQYGYLGRSWGCPAMDPAISDGVIDTLTGGALLLTWYPDATWYGNSPFLSDWTP